MRRRTLIATVALAAGAAAFGVVKAMPLLRNAMSVERHIRHAALREPAAEADWNREIGDPDQALSSFPSHEDTPAAIRLIELARSVGVDVARSAAARPGRQEIAAERALSQALKEYGENELTRSGGTVGAPPETVLACLRDHDEGVRELVAALVSGETLAWKTDLSLGHEAPLPNLLGHVRLQRLLVAEALARANRGEDEEAERVLLASWNLNGSLRARPEVMSQLIAISVARMQAGLGRRLSVDPVTWLQRYAEHDDRSSLLRAIEVESIVELRQFPDGPRWARASRADFLDARRALLTRFRSASPSGRSAGAPTERADVEANPMTVGGIVAAMGEPNLKKAVERADRLAVDIELTQHILEARLQAERLGRLPAAMPSFNTSRVPGAHWQYSVDGGGFSISFSGELHSEDRQGLVLPLHYEGRSLPSGRRRGS